MVRGKHLHPLAASENIIFAPKNLMICVRYQKQGFGRARDIYMFIGYDVSIYTMTFSVYTMMFSVYTMTFICLYAHNGKGSIH